MKANCSLQHNHSGPVVRTSWITDCPHWLHCFHFLSFPFCCPALCFCSEKEKRVKSSSDGEGASSSQSDSSASQGSLKGGGESRRPSSHLFLSSSFSLSLSLRVAAIVASRDGRVFSHLSKVGLQGGCRSADDSLLFIGYHFSLTSQKLTVGDCLRQLHAVIMVLLMIWLIWTHKSHTAVIVDALNWILVQRFPWHFYENKGLLSCCYSAWLWKHNYSPVCLESMKEFHISVAPIVRSDPKHPLSQTIWRHY